MTWLQPWGWLWLLMAGPLILLHILRVRRRRVAAPTLMFWNEVFQDSPARAWWQRIRNLVSLLLQLILLALLTAAIADPLSAGQVSERRLWVLLVDRSASMAMPVEPGSDGPSRLALAQEAALKGIRGMREWDQGMVVAFAADAHVQCGRTADPRRLAAAIRTLQPLPQPGRPENALALARALADGESRLEIVGFSDRPAPIEIAGSTNLLWQVVGEPVENVGIVGLASRPMDEQREWIRILTQVLNGGTARREVSVSLRADGALVDSLFFALEPGEKRFAVVDHPFPNGAVVEASIAGPPDALAADDRAVLVLPKPDPLRVGLVAPEPNLFVQQVLEAQSLVAWRPIAADQVSTATNLDLVVFHRTVDVPPDSVHALYLQPEADSDWWSMAPAVTNVIIDAVTESSTVVRHLSFDDILIRRAVPLKPKRAGETVLASFGDPLGLTWHDKGRKVAALGIDLARSDLPLRTAFPILVANLMQWYRSSNRSGTADAVPSGETAMFSVDVDHGSILAPDGSRRPWTRSDGYGRAGPFENLGIHQVLGPDDVPVSPPLAVNLVDAAETGSGHPDRDPSGPPASTGPPGRVPTGWAWWRWLALVALALCVTEWGLFQRRLVE